MSTEPPRRRTVKVARPARRPVGPVVSELLVLAGFAGILWVLATFDWRISVALASFAAIRVGAST